MWDYSQIVGVLPHCGNTPTSWEFSQCGGARSHVVEVTAHILSDYHQIVGVLPRCESTATMWGQIHEARNVEINRNVFQKGKNNQPFVVVSQQGL